VIVAKGVFFKTTVAWLAGLSPVATVPVMNAFWANAGINRNDSKTRTKLPGKNNRIAAVF
jgi:hypothetical protein